MQHKFKFGDTVRVNAPVSAYHHMVGGVINVSPSGITSVSLDESHDLIAFGPNELEHFPPLELELTHEEAKISPYHTRHIPKGVYGELSKVFEECDELKDADEQGNPILVLNELADIVGAIDGFVEKYHGMGIEDVIKMMRLNQKAFESGHRS
jgi:hypothetical protein